MLSGVLRLARIFALLLSILVLLYGGWEIYLFLTGQPSPPRSTEVLGAGVGIAFASGVFLIFERMLTERS